MNTAEQLQSKALRVAMLAVAMSELRDLGYALEPLVDRKVRSSEKEELVDEIRAALAEVEADEGASLVESYLEVKLDELEPASADDEEQAEEQVGADLMIVQILSWPYMPGLGRHDLIIDPKQSVIGRLKYRKINMRRAKELAAQGRKFNKKYSNSPELP